MAMSRRDFVAIAEAIKEEREGRISDPMRDATALEIARGVARHAKQVNSRFDKIKFLTACGFSPDAIVSGTTVNIKGR